MSGMVKVDRKGNTVREERNTMSHSKKENIISKYVLFHPDWIRELILAKIIHLILAINNGSDWTVPNCQGQSLGSFHIVYRELLKVFNEGDDNGTN